MKSSNQVQWILAASLCVAAAGLQACDGEAGAADDGSGPSDTTVVADPGVDEGLPNGPCDPLADTDCVEILRGESVFHRRPSRFTSFELNDRDTVRTVIRLRDLFDAEVAADPGAWRYQCFGSDQYTFGGYASWAQVLQGYMEVGTRRVVWEPTLELPDSWRVKDTYRIVLSPAGEG